MINRKLQKLSNQNYLFFTKIIKDIVYGRIGCRRMRVLYRFGKEDFIPTGIVTYERR